MKKSFLPLLIATLLIGGLAACEKEGPAERAGKQVDQTMERAGDKLEEAGDKVQDATRN